jgi:hypothetical protein
MSFVRHTGAARMALAMINEFEMDIRSSKSFMGHPYDTPEWYPWEVGLPNDVIKTAEWVLWIHRRARIAEAEQNLSPTLTVQLLPLMPVQPAQPAQPAQPWLLPVLPEPTNPPEPADPADES